MYDPAQGLDALPPNTKQILTSFVTAAREHLGDDLKSIVLFGSGAEGKLRETSDVNVLLLLSRFDAHEIDPLRAPFRVAEAAIRLQVMFLLEEELVTAAELFAVKFADMGRRHVTLFGADPLSGLRISRDAEITRLRQVLLNLVLRLRQSYVSESLREERLAAVIADVVGPLRAAAHALLELEGRAASSPKEALTVIATELGQGTDLLARLSSAREHGRLAAGVGHGTTLETLSLLNGMRTRAQSLR